MYYYFESNFCCYELIADLDGQTQGHKYFSDPHNIALGISLDGVTYFSRRQHSTWPVILVWAHPPRLTGRSYGRVLQPAT